MMKDSRQSGFTLLELLVSITMIGLIVLIVTGAMRLSYRSVSSGEKRIDQLERLRTTAGIIDAQIQSSFPLQSEADIGLKNALAGQSDSLDFATNYSLWKGRSGYVLAAYRIGPGQDGRLTLSLSEHTVGVEDVNRVELLNGYDEMRFSYYAKGATESEGAWSDAWTDETLLPEKIRLVMKKGARDLSITMPLRVRGTEDWTSFRESAPEDDQQ
jgi:general secretion pathway protein J